MTRTTKSFKSYLVPGTWAIVSVQETWKGNYRVTVRNEGLVWKSGWSKDRAKLMKTAVLKARQDHLEKSYQLPAREEQDNERG